MYGLTYTEQYLKCMLAENLLIHGFEKNAVICVLQTVAPDYQEHYHQIQILQFYGQLRVNIV